VQIIIVSWVSISQEVKPDWEFFTNEILSFYISINPFSDSRFTVILVILTGGLQILLLALLVNIVFSNKNMVQISPEPLYGPAYAPEEEFLVEKTLDIVTRVSKRMKIGVKKVFVYRKAVPNAFSLDLFPIPFLRRPYLVLNTNVLEILSDEQIEAVIAHELAHVKNGDSLIRLVISIPRLFLNLAYIFIYLQIITGILDAIFETQDIRAAIERAIFLVLIYLLIAVITKLTIKFLYSANHQAEYLADYFAATLVGSDILINSLIHLGQRSEAMQVLSREIEWLSSLSDDKKLSNTFLRNIYQRFPKTQLDEDIAREIAPRLFLEEKIDRLVRNYGIELDPDLKRQLIEQAVPTLREKRKSYFSTLESDTSDFTPSLLKEKTIDWRKFDSDASYYLETDELDSFIASLIAQPEKMVFEHELFQPTERDLDHPGFRERILNVYRIFHFEKYMNIINQIAIEIDTHSKNGTDSQS
jgi:Zn-dependent protease with chaperone function